MPFKKLMKPKVKIKVVEISKEHLNQAVEEYLHRLKMIDQDQTVQKIIIPESLLKGGEGMALVELRKEV